MMDMEANVEEGPRRLDVTRLLTTFVLPFLDELCTRDGLRSAHAQGRLADGRTLLALKQWMGRHA